MTTRDLLFEIGCEELPALQIAGAAKDLETAFRDAAASARIEHGLIRTFATPRRLAIVVDAVSDRQKDLEQLRVGPPVSTAFDNNGNPTRALLGFARSQGVQPGDLQRVVRTRRNKEAEYVAVTTRDEGRCTLDLLPDLLASLPGQISWQRSMRWGRQPGSFARPIRWLVALYGDAVVPLRVSGVESGRATRGHRFHAPGAVELRRAGAYVSKLRSNHVLADVRERRGAILKRARAAAAAHGGSLLEDDHLLDEVTHLVEWPVAISGKFDPGFLALPHKVLRSSMRKHQRYFPVVGNDGGMMPLFVTVANTDVQDHGKVARGNERVLNARLKDAEFFFREDRKRSLEGHAEALARVTYLKDLGGRSSMLDKSGRVAALTRWLCDTLSCDEDTTRDAVRAARLCKADLVTHMVDEFPDLQGFMGGEYARLDGESEAVAQGISEHYAPRGASDSVAASVTGAVVGIADRLDSIAALFSVGHAPTGAADPYALRRAALGVIRTLIKHGLRVHVPSLITRAVKTAAPQLTAQAHGETCAQVQDFIDTRLRYYLATEHPTEVVDAVLALGSRCEDLPAAVARVGALTRLCSADDFEPLTATFKRAANILDGTERPGVDPSLFSEEAERDLYAAVQGTRTRLDSLVAARDFDTALNLLAALRPAVDRLFNEVMVNDEDLTVRANRHSLLRDVITLLEAVADVRKL